MKVLKQSYSELTGKRTGGQGAFILLLSESQEGVLICFPEMLRCHLVQWFSFPSSFTEIQLTYEYSTAQV